MKSAVKSYLHLCFYTCIVLAIGYLYYLHYSGFSTQVVYVDSTRLLNGYQAMIQARKEYESQAKQWQSRADTLLAEVQQSIQSHEKQLASMSTKERELSRQLIQTKQRQLSEYQQAIAQKAREQDMQLTKKVLDQANAFLERYGQQHGYQIILAANQTGNIAYAQKKLDITENVLLVLNQEYGQK